MTWAKEQLDNGTFPRDEYNDFLQLVVISLGDQVENFMIKLIGPEHHAQWLSDFLKLKLICDVFNVLDVEHGHVKVIVELILLL